MRSTIPAPNVSSTSHADDGASGATLASVLYTWAPYRAVDVFARGKLDDVNGDGSALAGLMAAE